MNRTFPLISVIIPCYNAEHFVESAVNSIRSQSYSNLQIICINDCSNDKTGLILDRLSEVDPRIMVIHNKSNLKLIKTLNVGIANATGEYIARMDSDDLSLSSRIHMQATLLIDNPNLDVIGVNPYLINHKGVELGSISDVIYTSHLVAKFISMFNPPICHPSAMFRSSVLKKYMFRDEPESLHVEDYDLWIRMLKEEVKMRSIDERLFLYRLNPEGVSSSNRDLQAKNHAILSKEMIYYLTSIDIPISYLSILNRNFIDIDILELKKTIQIFENIKVAFFSKYNVYNEMSAFKEITEWYNQRIILIMGNYLFKGSISQRMYCLYFFTKHFRILLSKFTIRNIRARFLKILLK
ncbi:glycosyltransferase family 2 protein [Flectobacillus major]|uniref:glycosyltransferase family 2 protein n=1 Tax=Flectobacillus major TaxID=103 RepID=UPI0003F6C2AE|nr:glycosyltransferase family 2 protein [Flectobacillus major]